VPLSAEITCRFRPKSGAGLLRFLHDKVGVWPSMVANVRSEPLGTYEGYRRDRGDRRQGDSSHGATALTDRHTKQLMVC
jgi:hypothetical protein